MLRAPFAVKRVCSLTVEVHAYTCVRSACRSRCTTARTGRVICNCQDCLSSSPCNCLRITILVSNNAPEAGFLTASVKVIRPETAAQLQPDIVATTYRQQAFQVNHGESSSVTVRNATRTCDLYSEFVKQGFQ